MLMTDYYTIFYNITYCIPFDPSSCVAVDTGSSEFVTINEKIIPSTTYEIMLRGRILGYLDGDPVKVTVTTDKEGNKTIMTVVAVLVPLMALCFCTLYYCYKHRVFIREYCFRSTGKNDFSEHMDDVLSDRPTSPSFDESFQYDTSVSSSTYHVRERMPDDVTETSPSLDTDHINKDLAHPNENIMNGEC
ncbi:uncharacterized protein [Ptychodera flava]|uniref:uncharacterized protein n=1 Tax=Ptychodera flava TaxID=63121 RepID=UPI003969CBC8